MMLQKLALFSFVVLAACGKGVQSQVADLNYPFPIPTARPTGLVQPLWTSPKATEGKYTAAAQIDSRPVMHGDGIVAGYRMMAFQDSDGQNEVRAESVAAINFLDASSPRVSQMDVRLWLDGGFSGDEIPGRVLLWRTGHTSEEGWKAYTVPAIHTSTIAGSALEIQADMVLKKGVLPGKNWISLTDAIAKSKFAKDEGVFVIFEDRRYSTVDVRRCKLLHVVRNKETLLRRPDVTAIDPVNDNRGAFPYATTVQLPTDSTALVLANRPFLIPDTKADKSGDFASTYVNGTDTYSFHFSYRFFHASGVPYGDTRGHFLIESVKVDLPAGHHDVQIFGYRVKNGVTALTEADQMIFAKGPVENGSAEVAVRKFEPAVRKFWDEKDASRILLFSKIDGHLPVFLGAVYQVEALRAVVAAKPDLSWPFGN